jgi:TonB family protein
MKTKNDPPFTVILKFFLIVPVILLLLFAFSSCAAKKKAAAVQTTDETPYVVVEEMPMFPGGDSALLAYIVNNTKYPESAKLKGIEGRVIVRFCVTKEGSVDRISVLKGVNPELDAESVRVVGLLSSFKPGKQGGKPVNVWYMVPISFTLTGQKPSALLPPPPPPPPPANYSSTDKAFTEVDELPVFKGGDANLLNYIAENTIYPSEAKKNNITGKVIVRLVVEKNCSVSNVEVLQGVNPLLDAEAVRVVSSLPKFETPGKKAGEIVRVNYMIPITFSLK